MPNIYRVFSKDYENYLEGFFETTQDAEAKLQHETYLHSPNAPHADVYVIKEEKVEKFSIDDDPKFDKWKMARLKIKINQMEKDLQTLVGLKAQYALLVHKVMNQESETNKREKIESN